MYSPSKVVHFDPKTNKISEILPQLPIVSADFSDLETNLDTKVEVKFGDYSTYVIKFNVLAELFDPSIHQVQFNKQISGYAESLIYQPFSKFTGNMLRLAED
jgi:hypothetical protein